MAQALAMQEETLHSKPVNPPITFYISLNLSNVYDLLITSGYARNKTPIYLELRICSWHKRESAKRKQSKFQEDVIASLLHLISLHFLHLHVEAKCSNHEGDAVDPHDEPVKYLGSVRPVVLRLTGART